MMRLVGLCMFAIVFALSPALVAAEGGPDSPAAAPRNDAWKIIGPGGGGAQFYPTISPIDPDTVMVRCDMTGSYISKDGGGSWRMCCFRGTSSGFVFDPVDPDIIYVRGRGLYRSADGGATWELIYPDSDKVNGIGFYGDHAGERFSVSGEQRYIGALAVDPTDSRTLYAVFSGRESGQLRISWDWGETWSSLGDLPGRSWGMQIYVDRRSPKESRTVYVLGAGTVSVLEAGAWRHNGGPEGVRLGSVTAGFPSEGGKLVIYGFAGGWRGGSGDVHVSRDGGETWALANGDLYSGLQD
ncbi:MAG: WD40/YVTN/BNR-like repeat-containing protein, partial [Planctomycetota bacterium]